jgi:hypothetical protein
MHTSIEQHRGQRHAEECFRTEIDFPRDATQSPPETTQLLAWPRAAMDRLRNPRKATRDQSRPSSRLVILVHDDLRHIRSRHRHGCAVFLAGRGGLFVRNRANLFIVTFPVISLLEDEFLPVDQPALLDRPVVPVSLGRILGRGFRLFLLLLPLGAVFRRLRVECLLSFLLPLLKFLLI